MSKLIYCKGVHRESVSVFVWARTESSFLHAQSTDTQNAAERMKLEIVVIGDGDAGFGI